MHDLFIEIGCEEIPAKQLNTIAAQFASQLQQQLQQADIAMGETKVFATPRRLAVLINAVAEKQADKSIERKGPAQKAAYDDKGQPTKALLGFAQSCGVAIDALQVIETDKGAWFVFKEWRQGVATTHLLPELLSQAITKIAIAKPMRWQDGVPAFIRPVRWILALYNNQPLQGTVMGLPLGNMTYGHRVYAPMPITIDKAENYAQLLRDKGFVIADIEQRRATIYQQIQQVAKEKHGFVVIDEDLLTEVTGLVEWPVALAVGFNQEFLQLPQEVLITSMKTHQKCFALANEHSELLPFFITIANMQSDKPAHIIAGNQRVMTARLSDAKFFYDNDKKHPLVDNVPRLDNVLFQKQLGSLGDKMRRIEKLALAIGEQVGLKAPIISKAAKLSKCDLLSDMVGEFPELQGVMGHYYALHHGEDAMVALAIEEHYLPRFAGDVLPTSLLGAVIGIADRMDTLVGIFCIGQKPTGDKDPYALRRNAIGLLRLLQHPQYQALWQLNSKQLVSEAKNNLAINKPSATEQDIIDFIDERLRIELTEHYRQDVVQAVFSLPDLHSPYDIRQRISALQAFAENPLHQPLLAAYKRVDNILQKQKISVDALGDFKANLASAPELLLDEICTQHAKRIHDAVAKKEYATALQLLAVFTTPISEFFDKVMVMAEDSAVRNNRLALLQKVRCLFVAIADFSCLIA